VARQKISPWGFVGMGAMACVLFLDLGTVTLLPWWVTGLLLLLWVVLFLVATRWFVPHPRRVSWLPVLGFVVWLVCVLALGDRG
jgi:hypothetical protein